MVVETEEHVVKLLLSELVVELGTVDEGKDFFSFVLRHKTNLDVKIHVLVSCPVKDPTTIPNGPSKEVKNLYP